MIPYNVFINIKSSTMVNVIMNYATNFTSNIAPQLMRMIADIICLICLLVYLIKMSPVAIACMVLFFIGKYLFTGWADGLVAVYFGLSSLLMYFLTVDSTIHIKKIKFIILLLLAFLFLLHL